MKPRTLLTIGVLAHLLLQAGPAAVRVWEAPHGRDFASYHYAAQVAASGGDPYDTALLDAAARRERTRRSVQPYFYPPPFLLAMGWTLPLPLAWAYRAMFVLNEVLLAGVLWLCVRRFAMPAWAAATALALYTPIPDNAWMGQANYLALLPALAGLAQLMPRRGTAPHATLRSHALGGVLLGVAGMAKMSPALYLLAVGMAGRWRAFGVAALTAVGLTLLALPMVGPDVQARFYAEVLPGFARGSYHQLGVPIALASNHSLPNVWHQLWPGTATALSASAQRASSLTTLALLALWTARAWVLRRRAPADGDAPHAVLSPAMLGALTGILVITPTFTYEHHLVLLLPALGAAAGAVTVEGRAAPGRAAWWAVCFALLAAPLAWVAGATRALGAWGFLARESKTVAALMLVGALLAWARSTWNDAGMEPPRSAAPAARPSTG